MTHPRAKRARSEEAFISKIRIHGGDSKRVVAASKWTPRDDFRDSWILSEQMNPSAKTFWNSDRRRSPNQGPQERSCGRRSGGVLPEVVLLLVSGSGPEVFYRKLLYY